MKLLGKRSLSSLFKILLNIGFYGIILAFVLLMVTMFVASRSDSVNSSRNFRTSFEIDPGLYEIESSAGHEIQSELEKASGSAAIVLHRLRAIFGRLIERRPFAAENARDLRFIGLAIIAGEIIFSITAYWSTRLVLDQFTSSGVNLYSEFDIRVPLVLTGLSLLVVAEIFREGAQMKADLEAARAIQFSLVSDTEYQAGPVSIHSEMQPADAVGGTTTTSSIWETGGSLSWWPTWPVTACRPPCSWRCCRGASAA
jgi:hypothetical protein